MAVRERLFSVLRDPARLLQLSTPELDLFLRLAGPTRLMSRIEAHLSALDLDLPMPLADRLEGSAIYCARVQVLARFELDRIAAALGDLANDVVVLKGCAYMLSGHPVHHGRWFADVDLLAAREHLDALEARLKSHHWYPCVVSDYDEAYYRNWMHELPPMRHPDRGVEADLHHTISPLSGRLKVDGAKLLEDSRPVKGSPFRVLSSVDMTLHAIVHLFQDGELSLAPHQLLDIHELLEALHAEPGAWERLAPRAVELGPSRPLFYALRYCSRFLHTSIPPSVMADVQRYAPAAPVLALMDALVPRSLFPGHPDSVDLGGRLARELLYLRSHWVRMPPVMLARHLGYKVWLRVTGKGKQPVDPQVMPV